MSYLPRLVPLALVAVLALLAPALPAAAQGLDTEPNNTCPEAQDLGAATLPLSLTGGGGDCRLRVGVFQAAGSIRGRLIDADTGAPIPVGSFASVELQRCNEVDCFDPVAIASVDADGRFLFEDEFDGDALEAGSYAITARAARYEALTVGPFSVGEGEHLDLGDLAMTPLDFIGTVRGRLVDALDGAPLPGNGSPFSQVVLERCVEFGCFGFNFAFPDERGHFLFDGRQLSLEPGTYRLTALAEQYLLGSTETFTLAADESFDAGSFGLQTLAGPVHVDPAV